MATTMKQIFECLVVSPQHGLPGSLGLVAVAASPSTCWNGERTGSSTAAVESLPAVVGTEPGFHPASLLCQALHKVGIIHRDIKPANIVFDERRQVARAFAIACRAR